MSGTGWAFSLPELILLDKLGAPLFLLFLVFGVWTEERVTYTPSFIPDLRHEPLAGVFGAYADGWHWLHRQQPMPNMWFSRLFALGLFTFV